MFWKNIKQIAPSKVFKDILGSTRAVFMVVVSRSRGGHDGNFLLFNIFLEQLRLLMGQIVCHTVYAEHWFNTFMVSQKGSTCPK